MPDTKAKRLKFKKIDSRGIPLKEIIAVHREFAPRTPLADSLGDGFLYAMNPVFKKIRAEYLRRGFGFSDQDVCNYSGFPLFALDELIMAKTIPYKRNFPWVESMERHAPRVFTLTELKRSELQYNCLLHESAHFIAHDILFGNTNPLAM